MSTNLSPNEPKSSYPPPLDQLAGREFSFYPSIGNLDTNLWRMLEANWSEFLVENQGDQTQVWVPRRYLGDVSATDRPVMIVGLNRSLDFKAGQVWPVQKRIIEMPRVPAGDTAAGAEPATGSDQPPMRDPGIRLDASEKSLGRLILIGLFGAVVVVALVIAYFRGMQSGEMVSYQAVVQENLGLGPEDDYFAVERKLGKPQADRWKAEGESVQYRVLEYPQRNLKILLAGRERTQVFYVGAYDSNWRVVDSVKQRGGSTTYELLSRLPHF